MPQQDDNAAEVDHAEKVFVAKLIADDKPSEVLQPGKEALDLPAAAVATQRAAVLGIVLPLAAMRRDHLDAHWRQFGIQPVGIVSGIADEVFRRFADQEFPERGSDQRNLMWRSTCRGYGDRKTRAVCNCHDLGPLATLGLAQAEPPFLAGANVPSMKASCRSSFPLAFRSRARASSTPRIT